MNNNLDLDAIYELFIKPVDVAKILKLSKQTEYRLVHEGKLSAIRIGGSIRIYSKSLESLI